MSWCFSAYYIKTDNADALQAKHRKAKDVGSGWWAVNVSDSLDYGDAYNSAPDRGATLAFSKAFGEALYVYGYSGCDDMIYEHSRDGQLLRKLLWISDGSSSAWLCAAATPEPREEILFAPRQLAQALDAEDDESSHDAIRGIYEARRIITGSRWPSCDASVIDVVERHNGITRPR